MPFDEVHVAADVTFCVVPLDIVAVAVSCAAWPMLKDDVPVTVRADTDGVGAFGELPPQLTARAAMIARNAPRASRRRVVTRLN